VACVHRRFGRRYIRMRQGLDRWFSVVAFSDAYIGIDRWFNSVGLSLLLSLCGVFLQPLWALPHIERGRDSIDGLV